MEQTLIEIKGAVPRIEYLRYTEPVSWQINEGHHWAIIGPNGSGKTVLTDMLIGKYALKLREVSCIDRNGANLAVSAVVKSVAFRDIYSLIDADTSFYQQRWNKGIEQDVPIVKELVGKADQKWLDELVDWFGIEDLLEKEVNLLSSGELRKFLIVKSLLTNPRVLILDNPFIGLDVSSRSVLNKLLIRLSELDNLQIVLVLSDPADIPDFITDVLPVKDKKLYPALSATEFISSIDLQDHLFPPRHSALSHIPGLGLREQDLSYENVAVLNNINIKYGSRSILKDLNWTVKKGDKWALLGPNGSGKSTLLSLICGDNPQAYANDITLFDRKRGSGESIWDIKKRIGYVSPEMHIYYQQNTKCVDVVGSGFFDTIGLYRKCSSQQEDMAMEWMKLLDVSHLRDIAFQHVSSGEQRLLLFARAMVKRPELLILDEPMHGLDIVNKRRIKRFIESYCSEHITLIYVTHYQDELPDIIDKQLVLKKQQ